MGKRTRIGIVMRFDNSWIGGVYYIQNLLIALNTLPDEKKPLIDLYCKSKDVFDDIKSLTNYPYLHDNLYKRNFIKLCLRKAISFFNYDVAQEVNIISYNRKDLFIYPLSSGVNCKKLYWRPDFQEKYLPDYFSPKEISRRDEEIRSVCRRSIPIVFSSNDSLSDFKKFYPEYNNSTFVVSFAVSHPSFSHIRINDLLIKYGINKDFILCANQFWAHKNHLFLFKAYKEAISKGFDKQLVCTGAFSDYRNPNYQTEILSFISDNGLKEHIKLLGVIDRLDLLCLMKNSYAVIQPSLFEGWNTTVEDCKALNKFVFLSDLPVHREQLTRNVCFFNPRIEKDLVDKLLNTTPKIIEADYNKNIIEFGHSFYKVIEFMN